ncbi:MAG: hypothetical protein ABS85_08745 [Sphingobacteriales bacterium SCN 48-20]|uniref:DUF4476 domain-containing protein n=1 Tax=Terrimonas ferruginea TaxID=249 RepID=UPI00086DBAC4|nr:DUF4476 domain-containing protein [Terrimonas ferruginea]MBN8783177.1 DUF4476 domain-containing protein [Terrimonas ferruginea]ODT92661.1 MAG: hypothetical protein ABS85_08745 [Sphingobacteriales bacterium SCN 48-20]OJW39801.1 MAG: hypothetical protein BGO56_02740 [Sphingobacteriales bacterium 48-107]
MRTIFTLAAFLMMSITSFATDARNKSMLTVKSTGNEDIRVVLDGKRFEPNGSAISITNLEAGNHTIKVYRQQNGGFFSIVGKRYAVVYSTSINIRNKTHVMISIDRNGRTSVQETRMNNGRGNNNWYDGRDYQYDRDGSWGDYDNNEAYGPAMSNRDFDRVIASISKEWRETNKMKSAVQVVKANRLSASQVSELVDLFGIESNKLELAKVAYANTVDKHNYYLVSSQLSYSSKTELDRFIRRK